MEVGDVLLSTQSVEAKAFVQFHVENKTLMRQGKVAFSAKIDALGLHLNSGRVLVLLRTHAIRFRSIIVMPSMELQLLQ